MIEQPIIGVEAIGVSFLESLHSASVEQYVRLIYRFSRGKNGRKTVSINSKQLSLSLLSHLPLTQLTGSGSTQRRCVPQFFNL